MLVDILKINELVLSLAGDLTAAGKASHAALAVHRRCDKIVNAATESGHVGEHLVVPQEVVTGTLDEALGLGLQSLVGTSGRVPDSAKIEDLVAATRAAAVVAAVDTDEAGRKLLEEPWLSNLAAILGDPRSAIVDDVESEEGAGSRARLAAALAAAAAMLLTAECSGLPDELASRAVARLRTELLSNARTPTFLRHVEVSTLGDKEASEMLLREPRESSTPEAEQEPRQLLSQLCRRLFSLVTDDLTSCSVLLSKYAALPPVLRAARGDGGAKAAGVGASLVSLAGSAEFAAALEECPLPLTCALVDLAASEVTRLVAESDAGLPAAQSPPALRALLNACRFTAAANLSRRLADRGAVALLTNIVQKASISLELRYEAAESLCRLASSTEEEGLEEGNSGHISETALPAAALQFIAAPGTVSALIELSGISNAASKTSSSCSSSLRRDSGVRRPSGPFGSDVGGALQGCKEVLRYRLPWLLACVARGAASADISAWIQESLGVRAVIGDAIGESRSRHVRAWGVDLVAALAGRLPPEGLLEFLQRGPAPLLDMWPVLVKADRPSIWGSATICGYYVASCLPPGAPRREILAKLPIQGVKGQPPWRATEPGRSSKRPSKAPAEEEELHLSGAQRQLAELAVSAAITITSEASPASKSESTPQALLFASCRLVAAGLDALHALGWGQASTSGGRSGKESREMIFLKWLNLALQGVGRALSVVDSVPTEIDVAVEAAALFADVLDGPLAAPVSDGEESSTKDFATQHAQSDSPDAELRQSMRLVVMGLLETALLGPRLYPDLEAALASEISDQDLASGHFLESICHTPLVSLVLSTQQAGRTAFGRLLLRLFLRTFSCTAAEKLALQTWLPSREVLQFATGMDAAWLPFASSSEDLATLDAAAKPRVAVDLAPPPSSSSAGLEVAFSAGTVLRAWVGGLAVGSSGNFSGLSAILAWLDEIRAEPEWPRQRLLLTEALMQRLAENSHQFARYRFGAGNTGGEVLEAAVKLAAALTRDSMGVGVGGSTRDVTLHLCLLQLVEPMLSESATRADAASTWKASTLAETFAYLWALIQTAASGGGKTSSIEEPEEEPRKCHVPLWDLASKLLHYLLSSEEVVQNLCQSDENASVLRPLRWALGECPGYLPIFASKDIVASHEDPEDKMDTINLFEESWCPPGRVLLGAVTRLASLAVTLKRNGSGDNDLRCEKLLLAAMAAAGKLLAVVARPGNVLHSSAEIFALLESASAIIKDPPGEHPLTWRCHAGLLLVPLLHRPPMEAMLSPHTALGAIKQVPEGLPALKWCAESDEDVGLGAWSARARAVLKSDEDAAPVLTLADFGEEVPAESERPTKQEEVEPLPSPPPASVDPPRKAATTATQSTDPEPFAPKPRTVRPPVATASVQAQSQADSAASSGDAFEELAKALAPGPPGSKQAKSAQQGDALARDMMAALAALPSPTPKPKASPPKPSSAEEGRRARAAKFTSQVIRSEDLQAEALRAEVAALEAELGNIDAELDAEWAELQDELDAEAAEATLQEDAMPSSASASASGVRAPATNGTTHLHASASAHAKADAACGASTPSETSDHEQEVDGVDNSGRCESQSSSSRPPQAIANGAGASATASDGLPFPASGPSSAALSAAASQFLASLLEATGEDTTDSDAEGLAKARNSVMAELLKARRRGRQSSRFEAEAMLQVYGAHYANLPSGADVRAALQYLFENFPTDWQPQANVEQASSSEEEPGAEPCAEVGLPVVRVEESPRTDDHVASASASASASAAAAPAAAAGSSPSQQQPLQSLAMFQNSLEEMD